MLPALWRLYEMVGLTRGTTNGIVDLRARSHEEERGHRGSQHSAANRRANCVQALAHFLRHAGDSVLAGRLDVGECASSGRLSEGSIFRTQNQLPVQLV